MSIGSYTWLTGAVAVSGLVVVTQACGGGGSISVVGGDSGTDAGTGSRDGSGPPADSSTRADAGPHDAHTSSDAGVKPDSGTADSSVSADSGVKPDSGTVDSGVTIDSGAADAAASPDSGITDSGSDALDAGPDAKPSDSGSGCGIGGMTYASGAANPTNACESCQPGASTSAWTSAQGVNANCPAGHVCEGTPASCTSGCWIAGGFVSSGGTANSGCEVCAPGTSTTAWTDVEGAASCAPGKACNAGSCAPGCSIAGSFVSPGAIANSGCEVCTPGSSTTAWTDVFGAASCPAGETCNAGSCAACTVAATWSMTLNTVTAVPTLCQGVMDCTGDCALFNATSTSPTPTTLDWGVSPGGTICTVFSGQVSPGGQFSSDEDNCSPAGDGTTFDGQIDLAACSMSATYTYVLSSCTITYTMSGTQ